AVFQPRKDQYHVSLVTNITLQLRRGLSTAESTIGQLASFVAFYTSIAPRSFNRGKATRPPHRAALVRLQLRRGLSTAERGRDADREQREGRTSIAPRSFNRGKRPCSSQTDLALYTSIAPRSFNRGKQIQEQ